MILIVVAPLVMILIVSSCNDTHCGPLVMILIVVAPLVMILIVLLL